MIPSLCIPKIIHQTWKNKSIPEKYKVLYQSVGIHHKNWEFKLWTDKSMEEFVKKYYLEYYPTYKSYSKTIQRCDFFRYLVVYHYGGIYLDLDIKIIKSFDNLDNNVCIFFPCEKILTAQQCKIYNNRDCVRIANYAFGSVKKHPFFKYLLNQLIKPKNANRKILKINDILESTGPGILSTEYHNYCRGLKNNNIMILYPIKNIKSHCNCRNCGDRGKNGIRKVISCKVGDYGNHYHFGSWKSKLHKI